MPLGGTAARRYAEAILDIAIAEDAVDAYRASLERLRTGLDPRALRLLGDPSVPRGRRLDAAAAATADDPGPIQALLALLLERDRAALLPVIATAYGELVDERAGIVKAKVTTAIDLDRRQSDEIIARLGRATGKTVRASFAVDAALLGGATVQIADHLIDASLRTRLETLERELAR